MTHETSEMEAIRQRLARVERQSRMVKRTAVVIFLVACAVIAMGQAPAKRIVTADEFILKDSAGIVRATLGFAGVSHEPTLTLIDANGRERAYLTTEAIDFADANGTTRVLLGSSTAIYYNWLKVGPRSRSTDQPSFSVAQTIRHAWILLECPRERRFLFSARVLRI
jgi:hypothetical protein